MPARSDDKLRRVETFIKFWFSPWGAAKGARWDWFSNDMPFDNTSAHTVLNHILANVDQCYQWEAIVEPD